MLKCPYHDFETWRLLQYFYNGLTHMCNLMYKRENSTTREEVRVRMFEFFIGFMCKRSEGEIFGGL